MSLNKTQIDSLIDRNCKTSSVSYSVADKTADENLAMSKVWSIAFKAGAKWQFDDSNHTDYPIITTNLVANQRDYTFTSDEQGNIILDIYKVMVANEAGVYSEIMCVDQQSDVDMESFYNGQNTIGVPTRYDKTANGIFLDCIPSYNKTSGLKIFINREGSYFTTSDTTKMPGFSALFHEYVALEPTVRYFKRNQMFDLADRFNIDLVKMEEDIKIHYSSRDRDSKKRLQVFRENNR